MSARDNERFDRQGWSRAWRAAPVLLSLIVPLLTSSCITITPRSHASGAGASVIANMPMQKWGIESCGPGALSTVLEHYGAPVTMASLDASLPKMRGGVLTLDMILAARANGFRAEMVKGDGRLVTRWLSEGKPVILMLQVVDSPGHKYDFFHYIVVDGIDREKGLIRAQFGDGKGRWTTFERLEHAWSGGGHAAILIEPKSGGGQPLIAETTRPDADRMLREAVALEDQGHLEEAVARYDQLLQTSPSAMAWTNRGNALMQLGRNADAESSFRKALQIDALYRDGLNNLSWLLYRNGKLDEAEALARKAVAAHGPDEYLILDTLGRILSAKGACSDSAATFRDALAAVPASHPAARAGIEKAMSENAQSCRG